MNTAQNKKTVNLLLGLGGMALMMSSAVATAGIEGSVHDFSGTGTDQICVNCHTPHNASDEPNAPLWNHALTTAAHTVYSSGSFDGVITDGTTQGSIGGISKLCLSCHDGTVGVDSFGGTTADATKLAPTDSKNLGTDLGNDHPFSFDYQAAYTAEGGTNGGLHSETTTVAEIGGGAGAKSKTAGLTIANSMLDGDGFLQCSSCHDVHNEYVADTTGYATTKLLMITLDGSALCLTCHNK